MAKKKNNDHNFDDITESIKGKVILDKLSGTFGLHVNLLMVLNGIPPPSYVHYIELETLTPQKWVKTNTLVF